jgi:hypothetical protein
LLNEKAPNPTVGAAMIMLAKIDPK